MMQMSDTHPERRRVRHVFKAWRAEGEVQLTPESNQKLTAAQFLEVMGRHRFVLSPRGNGVDAHRTWEARRMCTARACACCAVRVRVHVHVACARVGTAWARRALYSADAARRLDPDRAAHRAPPSVRAAARTCGGRLERRNPSAAPCLLGQLHAAARGLRLRAPLCRPLVRTHRCATRALPRAPSCSHETTHRERQRWRRRRRRRRRRRAKLAASEDGDGVANPGWPRDGHTRPWLTEQTPPPREKTGGGQGGTSP